VDNPSVLIEEAREALHPPKSCSLCDNPINRNNLSGLCRKCRVYRSNYSQGRRCGECGKPITDKSKLGLCQACSQGMGKYTEGRQCGGCDKRIADWNVSGYCQACRKKVFVANKVHDRKACLSVRQENKQRQMTEKKGKCRKCKRGFQLERWQHSMLHWCPECRKGEDYQNYEYMQPRGRPTLPLGR